ncbi:hypothetical protein [Methanoregula sp.]|nr:hypothetical protein [Methanoregula sp.]MDD1686197.1 hypothetical protein [Methanoregula sp.]
MSEQPFHQRFSKREKSSRHNPGNDNGNLSLSALWELYHADPSSHYRP